MTYENGVSSNRTKDQGEDLAQGGQISSVEGQLRGDLPSVFFGYSCVGGIRPMRKLAEIGHRGDLLAYREIVSEGDYW
jgi:hypothetical protein